MNKYNWDIWHSDIWLQYVVGSFFSKMVEGGGGIPQFLSGQMIANV